MITFPLVQNREAGAVARRSGDSVVEVTGAAAALQWNLNLAAYPETRRVGHNRAVVLVALELIDEMEATLKYASDERLAFFAGIRSIHQRFLRLLADDDVLPFESTGMTFDHRFHEAVFVTREPGREPGRITEEFRRGYTQRGIVVRMARVRVAGWKER